MLIRYACIASILLLPWIESLARAAEPRPNIVLILADDLGYGDVGCFGETKIKTPNLDRLAQEGARFTSFYAAQAVCTASRAALMSGCYANRVGLAGALNHTSTEGIHEAEFLLPELCKQQGYATAVFGKWHLGTRPKFNPLKHGFDEYLGLPYSNDNSKYHPVIRTMPPLPLYDGERVAEVDPDQSQFTRRFTERALQFIDKHHDRPFFLYVPHVMPHVPIFASASFQGRSAHGLYGDVVEELDWSIGEIMSALKRLQLDQRTLVIFASDNGPFLSYGDHAGSSGKLREGKLTSFEGGVRVPCIMRWPNQISAGSVCDEPCAAMDLLPTIADLLNARLSENRIDGRSIRALMTGGSGAKSPHEALYFYAGDELQAVRGGDWKLHVPHDYLTVAGPPGRNGKPANFEYLKPASIAQSGIRGIATRHGYGVARIELALFNVAEDPGETMNVAAQHPEIVNKLTTLLETMRSDLGDELTKTKGTGLRPVGRDAG